MFITHRPTVTLQLHNFDLFRTCRTSSFCTVASRGPSAIAELLVGVVVTVSITSSVEIIVGGWMVYFLQHSLHHLTK